MACLQKGIPEPGTPGDATFVVCPSKAGGLGCRRRGVKSRMGSNHRRCIVGAVPVRAALLIRRRGFVYSRGSLLECRAEGLKHAACAFAFGVACSQISHSSCDLGIIDSTAFRDEHKERPKDDNDVHLICAADTQDIAGTFVLDVGRDRGRTGAVGSVEALSQKRTLLGMADSRLPRHPKRSFNQVVSGEDTREDLARTSSPRDCPKLTGYSAFSSTSPLLNADADADESRQSKPGARNGLRRLVAWLQRVSRMAAELNAPSRHWKCSTAFSGIGCAEIAGAALNQGHPGVAFTFGHAVEKEPRCRAFIVDHSPDVRCCGDILDWLPPTVDRVRLAALDMPGLRRAIIDQHMQLIFRAGTSDAFEHKDVHVAGPPCVDFSAMGLQRREQGPTRILFFCMGAKCAIAKAFHCCVRKCL